MALTCPLLWTTSHFPERRLISLLEGKGVCGWGYVHQVTLTRMGTLQFSVLGLIVVAGVEVTRKRRQINRFSEKNAKVNQSSWCLSGLSLASLVHILIAEWAGVIKRLALILSLTSVSWLMNTCVISRFSKKLYLRTHPDVVAGATNFHFNSIIGTAFKV